MNEAESRAAFKYFMKKSGVPVADFLLQQGTYIIREVRIAWVAWQAALTTQAEVLRECGEENELLETEKQMLEEEVERLNAQDAKVRGLVEVAKEVEMICVMSILDPEVFAENMKAVRPKLLTSLAAFEGK